MARDAACIVLLCAGFAGCGSGAGSPPVGPGDPAPGAPVVPTILHTIVLVREDRSTGDTDILLGDTAGGPLAPLTDTPLAREDMCAINHDGTVAAFRREGQLVATEGTVEVVAGAGAVSHPYVEQTRVYWTLGGGSFVGLNLDTDVDLTLLTPPGARQVDELSGQSSRVSCSAVVPPSSVSRIWILETSPEFEWRPLQAMPDGDEQFQSALLGDWIVYSFRDGTSPFAGLRIANVLDGTILRTIRSAEADLTNPGWFHGEYHDEVAMEPLSPESAGYDLIYVKTWPGARPSIVTRDLETSVEAVLYAADDAFAYLDFKVALGTGYP